MLAKTSRIDFNFDINSNVQEIVQEIEHTFQSHDLDLILSITKHYAPLREVEVWPTAVNTLDSSRFSHSRNINDIIYTKINK